MPANLKNESFPQPPDSDIPIWRYIDLPRLIQLLDRSQLYLCRLDLLSDPAEGTYPPAAWGGLVKKFAGLDTRMLENITNSNRQCLFVSCWCAQDHESQSLWSKFGKDTGVAIRTTYRKLADSLDETMLMGQVGYLDYKTGSFDSETFLSCTMHKRREFKDECEVRVAAYDPPELYGPPDGRGPAVEPAPEGVWRTIDLACIESVVTSPHSPRWVEHAVQCLVHRFQPSLRVERSAMIL